MKIEWRRDEEERPYPGVGGARTGVGVGFFLRNVPRTGVTSEFVAVAPNPQISISVLLRAPDFSDFYLFFLFL